MNQIEVLQNNNNNIVTKANVLIEANYKLTLTEQKIVLFLVSKIRKKDEDFQIYRLPIKEFCELMGLSGTPKYTELRKITKVLMSKVMEIKEGKKTKQISWISYVEYDEDRGAVLVSFDPRLKPYLLELKKEFTSYRLKNVMVLKSSYSIRIYEILKKWETVKSITISIEDLRKMLGVDEKYKEYHNFKKRVLKTAQEELSIMTDIRFDYDEIKSGKKVEKLKFIIHTQTGALPDHNLSTKTIDEEISQLISKCEYKIEKKTAQRWSKLAKEKWKDNTMENLLCLIDEVNQNNEIENPIGFITHILKIKDDNRKSISENTDLLLSEVKSLFRDTSELIPNFLAKTKVQELLIDKYCYSEEKFNEFWDKHNEIVMASIINYAKKNVSKRKKF